MDTTSVLAIAIGATAAVFTAAEIIIFKAFGIGSDEYKNIITFSRKNKNISELRDVFKKIQESNDYISGKISYIEREIKKISYNRINALDSEIKSIKQFLENQGEFFEKSKELEEELLFIRKEYKQNDSKIQKLNKYTSELNNKICNYSDLYYKVEKLEKIILEKKKNESLCLMDSGDGKREDLIAIVQNKFNSDITALKEMIENSKVNTNSIEIKQVYEKIGAIEDSMSELGKYSNKMRIELNDLLNKYDDIKKNMAILKKQNDEIISQRDELLKDKLANEEAISLANQEINKIKATMIDYQHHKANLFNEITLLKGKINTPENTTEKKVIVSEKAGIDSVVTNNDIGFNDMVISNNSETVQEKEEKNIILADEEYVNMLENNFKQIEDIIPRNIQVKFKKFIDEIDDDDLDDSEELLKVTNRIINECVVKSFNKVKSDDLPRLIQFIEKAGYKAINVSDGDLFKDYIKYFEPVFSEKTENSCLFGTIKNIILKPYRAYTKDLEEVILYGECIYYK